jgi:uncharacterized protein (TIGR03435 family)
MFFPHGPRASTFLLATLLLAAPFAHAQSAVTSNDALLRSAVYEVVAIHPVKNASENIIQVDKDLNPLPGQKITSRFEFNDHGTLTVTSMTLETLLCTAWNLRDNSQLHGGPAWLKSQRFNITAKPSEEFAATYAALDKKTKKLVSQHMLQALLAERFGLKAHRASEEKNILALEIAKGGIKLKPLDATKAQSGGMTIISDSKLKAHGTSLDALASLLTFPLQKTVQNQTGDKNLYDIDLNWRPDTAADAASSDEANAPSLYTALEEQLGLKLVPRKGTVETLVIDQAQMPSED